MGRRLFGGRKKLAIWLGLLLPALAVGLWLERSRLLAWYYVFRLARADDNDRGRWTARVAGLGADAIPRLLCCLERDDARACTNARTALVEMSKRWEPDNPDRSSLGDQLVGAFPRMKAGGKQAALCVEESLLNSTAPAPLPPNLVRGATRLLAESAGVPDSGVRRQALVLAQTIAGQGDPKDSLGPCRGLIRACLRDEEPQTRVEAIRLAGQRSINLLEPLALLLRDPVSDVRRAALLVLGPAPEVIATDDLLYWLHDPDPTVRRICDTALRGRGLRDDHIQLGRLITDPEVKTRLRVLDCLHQTTDLEPGVWLRRLSHDPVAAVRAAAMRAAAEHARVDLTDRLDQIAHNDPSPTVRQLAGYYLTSRRPKSQ